MRQVFISYARDDREVVEKLAAKLRRLVDSVWFDSQLHGGEDWWTGILERIRGCDVFLAVVSESSLESEACRVERTYARQLGRTILPVALEEVPQALPSDLATLQIVDFSTPGEDAVADLARALLASPGAVPLPDPLPDQPEPPLSYLTSLVDLVTSPRELTKSEQMEIVVQLERGLEASDPDEREGARHVLRRMASRDDLASSVEKTIALLEKEHLSEEASSRTRDGVAVAPVVVTAPRTSATVSRPSAETGQPPRAAQPATQQHPVPEPAGGGAGGRRRPLLVGVVLAVIAVLVGGGIWAAVGSQTDDSATDDPGIVETPDDERTTDPDDPDPATEPPPPPPGDPCEPPPSSFPGEVRHGTSSDSALQWQRLLVREGIFSPSPENCTGDYTGPRQQEVVAATREGLGLDPAEGLLDKVFYSCLVGDGACEPPCIVPDLVGLPEDQAVARLEERGLQPVVDRVEEGQPFGVVRVDPPPGSEIPCGEPVTITVSTLL